MRIVDRPLADAIGEAGGPYWRRAPAGPDAPGCVGFDRAFLVVPQFLPVTVGGETFRDAFAVYGPGKYAHLYGPETAAAIERRLPALLAAGDATGTFVLGGARNHFHWLADFLPRLALLAADPALAGGAVLVNHDLDAAQGRSLDFVTAALGLRLPALRPVADGIVGVRRVAVPVRATRVAAVRFWDTVLAAAGVARVASGRRLFVRRGAVARRRLVDEDAVAATLTASGFDVIDPGTLSFAEQVRTFAAASIIVGTHGAALANILLAPRMARIVELRGAAHTSEYRDLARAAGQPYAALRLQEIAGSDPEPLHRDVRLGEEGLAALRRFAERRDRP
ncbi:MAG: glycosyltransferase family 61 protein [Alphaproteobacteria bacterium]|nr:glycosyltransferase family 61 protein [Alphaproteobacteria bacterium]